MSTKRFIGTSTTAADAAASAVDESTATSAADAGDIHGEGDLPSPAQDATVMAAVDWMKRRRWADIALLSLTDGSENPNEAAG